MFTFEIGKKYFDTSACDHNCVFVIEITKRTAKTVTFLRDGKERRAKIDEEHKKVSLSIRALLESAPMEGDEDSEEAPVEEAPAAPDPLAAYMPQVPQAAPQPAMVMVGQPVLCDCGAMFPQVGGVIIGFVEKEATRWTPAATMAVIRWADGRQDFHKLSDIHPQGWRSQNGSGLGVFFAR